MTNQRKALIFDLDMTLVDSSCLRPLRESRNWPAVYRKIPDTKLFPGMRELLARLCNHFQIGIVTSAPRTYAVKLLDHHGLDIPVLCAYHDTQRHKPDPEPILTAISRLGLAPEQTCCIGDETRDIVAANKAGAVSIAVTWGMGSEKELSLEHPRFLVRSVAELGQAILPWDMPQCRELDHDHSR